MNVRPIILAAAVGASLGAVAFVTTHPSLTGRAYARAIASGEVRAKFLTPDDAEDDALINGANEAGYRWAERNGIDNPVNCPTSPPAYRAGCLDYIGEGMR